MRLDALYLFEVELRNTRACRAKVNLKVNLFKRFVHTCFVRLLLVLPVNSPLVEDFPHSKLTRAD